MIPLLITPERLPCPRRQPEVYQPEKPYAQQRNKDCGSFARQEIWCPLQQNWPLCPLPGFPADPPVPMPGRLPGLQLRAPLSSPWPAMNGSPIDDSPVYIRCSQVHNRQYSILIKTSPSLSSGMLSSLSSTLFLSSITAAIILSGILTI